MRAGPKFRPFEARGRRAIVAILLTFGLFFGVSVTLSIWATTRSQNRATVVEVAARQRTLAERYVKEILLKRRGDESDPQTIGKLLAQSVGVLLDGGTVPGVEGDDDETKVPAATEPMVRAQLVQQRRLIEDLTTAGRAFLAHRPADEAPTTAHERITATDPVMRLRILAALTSGVSLNAARTIAARSDRNITELIRIQVLLGIAGLLTSLLLAWALIAAARRQSAHFRSLVSRSTDLVLVFGAGGCRYVSQSVATMLGQPDSELLGQAFSRYVHPDDRPLVEAAYTHGEPHEIVFRMLNKFDEWRHLEAHVTDLRDDR